MTNPTPQYESGQSLVSELAPYSPIMHALLEAMRPMVEPYLTAALGTSPWDMRSPLSQQSSTGAYTAADQAVWAAQKAQYNVRMGYYQKGNTLIGGIAGTTMRELTDARAMGDEAYGRAMRDIGAGHSFAASSFGDPRSLASTMGGGTTMEDITAAMSDLGQMSGNLRQGERQVVVERMLRSSKDMLKGYSDDMASLQDTATVSPDTGLLQGKEGMDADARRVMDRVNNLRRGVKEMDAAMAAWKEVLNRDVAQSLDAMGALFGGDAVATFNTNANTLQRMALRVQHTSALTGHNAGYIMGGTQNATKALAAFGAPTEGGLMMATWNTNYGFNLGGYRGSQSAMEQGLDFTGANIMASPYAKMLAGGYERYLSTEEGFKLGPGEESRKAYEKLLEGAKGEDGLYTAEGLNAVLSTKGADPLTASEYREQATSDVARDYLTQSDFIYGEGMKDANKKARESYLGASSAANDIASAVGEDVFFSAMGEEPGSRRQKLAKALAGKEGWDERRIRETIAAADAEMPALTDRLIRQQATGWENRSASQAGAAHMRVLSSEAAADARREEVEARTALSLNKAKSGTYLQAGIDMLQNDFSSKGVSLRGLFSGITGIGGKELDALYQMGGGANDEKAFKAALEGAKERLAGQEGVSPDAMIKDMFTQLQTATRKGDPEEIEAARKHIKTVLGGSFDESGKYSFGAPATGNVEDAVKAYKTRTDPEISRKQLYDQAGRMTVTDPSTGHTISTEEWQKKVKEEGESTSLANLGMSVEERKRTAMAAAMAYTLPTLANSELVNKYTEKNGQYELDGHSITKEQYQDMQQQAKLHDTITEMLAEDSDFRKGKKEAVDKATAAIKGSATATEAYGEYSQAAGATFARGSLEDIIPILLRQLVGGSPIPVKIQQ